jgi:hypothetical protein
MTANRTQKTALDQRLILELRIDASGEVTRKPSQLGRKDTLEGKAPRATLSRHPSSARQRAV